jgi:hypothetical protein
MAFRRNGEVLALNGGREQEATAWHPFLHVIGPALIAEEQFERIFFPIKKSINGHPSTVL